ncbi:MAG: 3-hydroxyacyl-ACP dehydratase FabZ family protein [Burkholderiaceae bacterium]
MQSLPFSIAADHPAYAGHFPGMPITPGVVLLDEAMHRIAQSEKFALRQCKISNAKFLKPVLPGARLVLHYESRPNGSINFEIKDHEESVVALGSFSARY